MALKRGWNKEPPMPMLGKQEDGERARKTPEVEVEEVGEKR
jgi:hypothetical protein